MRKRLSDPTVERHYHKCIVYKQNINNIIDFKHPKIKKLLLIEYKLGNLIFYEAVNRKYRICA